MDNLEKLRGNYEVNKLRLERCRDMLVSVAESYVPVNYEEIIEESGVGEIEFSLSWVEVPDPANPNSILPFKVMPVLDICKANKEIDENGGLYAITIYGELPSGEECAIGSVFTKEESNSSGITLSEVGYIGWECADAEIFLKLAESALLAQTNEE